MIRRLYSPSDGLRAGKVGIIRSFGPFFKESGFLDHLADDAEPEALAGIDLQRRAVGLADVESQSAVFIDPGILHQARQCLFVGGRIVGGGIGSVAQDGLLEGKRSLAPRGDRGRIIARAGRVLVRIDIPFVIPVDGGVARGRREGGRSGAVIDLRIDDADIFQAGGKEIVDILDGGGVGRGRAVHHADLIEHIVADHVFIGLGGIPVAHGPAVMGAVACSPIVDVSVVVGILADFLVHIDVSAAVVFDRNRNRGRLGPEFVLFDAHLHIGIVEELGDGAILVDLVTHDPDTGFVARDRDFGVFILLGNRLGGGSRDIVEGPDVIQIDLLPGIVLGVFELCRLQGHTDLRTVVEGEGKRLPVSACGFALVVHRDPEVHRLALLHGLDSLDGMGAVGIAVYGLGDAVADGQTFNAGTIAAVPAGRGRVADREGGAAVGGAGEGEGLVALCLENVVLVKGGGIDGEAADLDLLDPLGPRVVIGGGGLVKLGYRVVLEGELDVGTLHVRDALELDGGRPIVVEISHHWLVAGVVEGDSVCDRADAVEGAGLQKLKLRIRVGTLHIERIDNARRGGHGSVVCRPQIAGRLRAVPQEEAHGAVGAGGDPLRMVRFIVEANGGLDPDIDRPDTF